MNHNPRKFEEKIALNKQKQAEQDKQFEDIIRDVNTIRDEVPNTSQSFRSLPNINGPPPGVYQPYMSFGGMQQNQHNMWHEDIHHHLNLPNEYGQNRRVLSDSQLHKPSMRMDNNNNDEAGPYSISRPKSADMLSYENNFLSKTGSLPDLSGSFLPVQDESFSQSILHNYQDPHDQQRMQVSPPSYHMHQQQQGFFMSLDEATASDLQRSHQFSPVPSPPSTAQFSYSYSNIGSPQIGSPNQSYAHLTNQMQDFHLHSGAGSPGPPSGAASPEMRNESYIHQEEMKPYIYYPSPHEQHHQQQDINYQNPPSIPKIQVYTPEEALSPQFYPPDEQMGGQEGQQEMNLFDFDNAMIEQQLLEDETVQASMDGMYSYVYPHS